MAILRLTKEFSFETAHFLEGYDGRCSQIHGHSYRLFITVKGSPEEANSPKKGMVFDFGLLKKLVNEIIIDRFDHTLVVAENHTESELTEVLRRKFDRIEIVPYQPTCERMIEHFVELLKNSLPSNIELYSIRLHETATSYVEWNSEDNQ